MSVFLWHIPAYLKYDPASGRDITPEETKLGSGKKRLMLTEQVVYTANKYHLHVSLNLHGPSVSYQMLDFMNPLTYGRGRVPTAGILPALYYVGRKSGLKCFPELLVLSDLVNEPGFKEDMNDQFSPPQPFLEVYTVKSLLDAWTLSTGRMPTEW